MPHLAAFEADIFGLCAGLDGQRGGIGVCSGRMRMVVRLQLGLCRSALEGLGGRADDGWLGLVRPVGIIGLAASLPTSWSVCDSQL